MEGNQRVSGALQQCDLTSVMNEWTEIIEHVLQFLPGASLEVCKRVCRNWKEIADRILENRIPKVQPILYGWHREDKSGPSSFKAVKLEGCRQFKDATGERIQWLPLPPKVTIMFVNNETWEKVSIPMSCEAPSNVKPTKSNKKIRWSSYKLTIEEYINKRLPSNCPILGAVAGGAIGTPMSLGPSLEIESGPGCAIAFIPEIPGLEVHHFLLPFDYDSENLPTKEDYENMTGISKDKHIKAMILLQASEYDVPFDAAHCFWSLNRDIAIAGGKVDNIIAPDLDKKSEDEACILGIAFSGDNVQAASVMVESHIRDPKEVECQIKKLKDCNISEENSFAFMFACLGRGYYFYRKSNVEADIFRKLFPRTPLFGFFGNGETGYNFLPDYSKTDPYVETKNKNYTFGSFDHGYTTIFCLISVNPTLPV
ncbi:F-box only protein 22 [Lingula anatina]|uniref:F-box only protein 22 n=1 Tax=Lingula anatina TaxID=7574 RepID=A0A1S3I785_LINAN|nr:F-box only protein 22 [Lingula anatina]|eukprot:XP_013394140.1 F-box only protein 22 [Lingula anatina]